MARRLVVDVHYELDPDTEELLRDRAAATGLSDQDVVREIVALRLRHPREHARLRRILEAVVRTRGLYVQILGDVLGEEEMRRVMTAADLEGRRRAAEMIERGAR